MNTPPRRVLLYRLGDLPVVHRWALLVPSIADWQRAFDVPFFAYRASESALTNVIWSFPESELHEEVTQELLKVASAVAGLARGPAVLDEPAETLTFGFHASASLETLSAALAAAGFEVVRSLDIDPYAWAVVKTVREARRVGAPDEPRAIADALETMVSSGSPAIVSLHAIAGSKDREQLEAAARAAPDLSDLVWSRDGQRLLACADDVRVLRRGTGKDFDGASACAESACGGLHIRLLDEAHMLPPRVDPRDNAILSADFDAAGRIVSGFRHGELRRGHEGVDASTHALVARFEAPVRRVRVAPSGRHVALIVGTDLVVVDGEGTPHVLGKAGASDASPWDDDGSTAYVAWSGDGESVAVCVDGELVVHSVETRSESRRARIAREPEPCGEVGWSTMAGFVVPCGEGLVVVANDGSQRLIRRAVQPRGGTLPGRLTVSADGRIVVVHFLQYALDNGSTIEVFDLARDEAHLLRKSGSDDGFRPLALAPSGDAMAYGSSTASVWIDAWSLSVSRDDALEQVRLAEALLQQRKIEEAKLALDTMPSAHGRPNLLHRVAQCRAALQEALGAARTAAMPKVPARPPAADESDLEEGHSVVHPKFGRGTIVSLDGDGAQAFVTVDFSGTTRRLRASVLRASR